MAILGVGILGYACFKYQVTVQYGLLLALYLVAMSSRFGRDKGAAKHLGQLAHYEDIIRNNMQSQQDKEPTKNS